MSTIGYHTSVAGGWGNAFGRSKEIGGDSLQIFTKSPRVWKLPAFDEEQIAWAQQQRTEHGQVGGIVHSSYLINLAKPYDEVGYGRDNMLFDFKVADALGFTGVNVHIGKSAGKLTPTEAMENMQQNVIAIIEEKEKAGYGAQFVFENTAGQGTEMGYRFEELGQFLNDYLGDYDIGVCLDTCHLWAAGYDVGKRDEVMSEFDEHVGAEKLVCIHINDAKVPLGSRLDRHANHGHGFVGYQRLANVMRWARDNNMPLIGETPDTDAWADELARMRQIVDGDDSWIAAYDRANMGSSVLKKFERMVEGEQGRLL